MYKNNCELRIAEDKGEGLYAVRDFQRGELVMKCQPELQPCSNNVHASQVGMNKWVLFKGLGAKINHSCEPTCGIQCDEDGYHKLWHLPLQKQGRNLPMTMLWEIIQQRISLSAYADRNHAEHRLSGLKAYQKREKNNIRDLLHLILQSLICNKNLKKKNDDLFKKKFNILLVVVQESYQGNSDLLSEKIVFFFTSKDQINSLTKMKHIHSKHFLQMILAE